VAGCTGDIATHAINLACFVTGLRLDSVAADLATFLPGRVLDDNANIMLRFAGGAKGMLWASQVAPGNENGLRLRVYGERGGLEWAQEDPNYLRYAPYGKPPELIRRGGAGSMPVAGRVTRVPAGHPEGYLEGFANLYSDAAELIWAKIEGRAPDEGATLVPTVADGVAGVAFIEAVVASSRKDGAWVKAEA
jgi:predicted dehydrogenase